MSLLAVTGLTKHFAHSPVLRDVTFQLAHGDRVCLVGPNGTGKTTLLRILAGELDPDQGSLQWSSGAQAGILQQYWRLEGDRTVWELAEQALGPLIELASTAERIAAQMGATADPASHQRLAQQYQQMHDQLHHRGAYELDFKIQRVLLGLGINAECFHRPARTLSGGQHNRLKLARLLLAEPDLMLLDEPSNHLDIAATEWLEEFLTETRQAFIVVSHDRYFLDRVSLRTLELVGGRMESYPGNFSKYQELKQQRLEVERRTFENQRRDIEKMEQFVRRNRYGQKHAQAEDRKKKLERIELVPPPREISIPSMTFAAAERSGDIVIRAEALQKGYGPKPLFSDLSFTVQRGQRWGIVGRNGCGKTTLLHCLLDKLPLDAGKVTLGAQLNVALYDQQLASLEEVQLPVEAVRPPGQWVSEQHRRDILARFGIVGDMALQPIQQLSGGQRSRVALARLTLLDANLLVLDEPTNHLDLWARQGLTNALREFSGTVLLVSHDRHLIDSLCDHLLVFECNRIRLIQGNYQTYLALRQMSHESSGAGGQASPMRRDSGRHAQPTATRRQFPYRKIEEIEAEIATRENAVNALHADLADPHVLRSRDRVVQVKQQLDEQLQQLTQLYAHWEEAHEFN